jgi:hypothetical protein
MCREDFFCGIMMIYALLLQRSSIFVEKEITPPPHPRGVKYKFAKY